MSPQTILSEKKAARASALAVVQHLDREIARLERTVALPKKDYSAVDSKVDRNMNKKFLKKSA